MNQYDPQQLLTTVLRQRFRLDRFIGQGAMGMVFYACDLRQLEQGEPQPYVAIKILHPALAKDERFLRALQRESKRCQQLTHPNIVKVFDYDRIDGYSVMIMEYVAGYNLKELLHNQSVSDGRRQRWAQQLIDALRYAHRHHIVHADIKPANVLIDAQDQLRIIDFGIAQVWTENTAKTVNGFTPAYSELGVLAGQPAGAYQDCYAAACILCELLGDQHPFFFQPLNMVAPKRRRLPPRMHLRRGLNRALFHCLALGWARSKQALEATVAQQAVFEQFTQSKGVLYALAQELDQNWHHWRRAKLLAIIVLALFAGQASFGVFKSVRAQQREQRLLTSINQQNWPQVWSLLSARKDRKELSTALQTRLIDGGIAHVEQLKALDSADYQPKLALELLKQLKTYLPDSNRLSSALAGLNVQRDQDLQTILRELDALLDPARACALACLQALEPWVARLQRLAPSLWQQRESLAKSIAESWRASAVFEAPTQQQQLERLFNRIFNQAIIGRSSLNHSALSKLASIDIHTPSEVRVADPVIYSAELMSRASQHWQQLRNPGTSVTIAELPMGYQDPCSHPRQSVVACQDQWSNGQGPSLLSVRLDTTSSFRLAIAKHELSWRDLSAFCATEHCTNGLQHQLNRVQNAHKSAFGLGEQDLNTYLDWLSKNSGHKYQLLRLDYWRKLADPVGLLADLIDPSTAAGLSVICKHPDARWAKQLRQERLVVDRMGFVNLQDGLPELVEAEPGEFFIVPGRWHKLHHCTDAIAPERHPRAGYRVMRFVQPI